MKNILRRFCWSPQFPPAHPEAALAAYLEVCCMEVANLPKASGYSKEAVQGHHMTMFQCHYMPSSATAACSLGLFLFKFCAGKGLNSFVDFVSPVSASPFLWIFFFSSYCSFLTFSVFCPLLVFISPSPCPSPPPNSSPPFPLPLSSFSVFLFLVWSF